MKWVKDSGDKALPFLMETEWAHINLNEKVLQRIKQGRTGWKREGLWILADGISVRGSFWFRPGGYLLPAFDQSLESCPPLPLKTASIRGIMSTVENMNLLTNQLPESDNPHEYRIMTHDNPIYTDPEKLPEHISFELADSSNWPELYPMELAYQKEEVYGNRRKMDNHVVALSFRKLLKTREVFILKRNGVTIGKANTNSSGRHWDQIGGVYTLPEYRDRGFATVLLKQIVTYMYKKDRKLSLFVKTGNKAALKLYKTCGFSDRGAFHLGYYNTPPGSV